MASHVPYYAYFHSDSEHGKLTFQNPTYQGSCFHTIMSLEHITQITRVHDVVECDPAEVFKSVSLYLNADNYIEGNLQAHASIMCVDGVETLKKLNFLKAERVGVYLLAPGYRFDAFNKHKFYDWLNGGIREYGTKMNVVRNAFPKSLVLA